MKFKVVGWLDLVFGSLGLIQQILLLFFVYPKLTTLYQDFQTRLPASTQIFPYLSLAVSLLLVLIVILGAKLAFGQKPAEKTFKLGVVALIAILILGGIYLSTSTLSLLSPIYSLSSNLSLKSNLPPEKQVVGYLSPAPKNLIVEPTSNEPTAIPLAGRPPCTAKDLSGEWRSGEPVMAGGMVASFGFKNISQKPCYVIGYPNIQLIGNKGQDLRVKSIHTTMCTEGIHGREQYIECPAKPIVISPDAGEAVVGLYWTSVDKSGLRDAACPSLGSYTALLVTLPNNNEVVKITEPRSEQPFIPAICGNLSVDQFR